MGWNSWDAYGTTVTEAQVKANADAMARKLARFGWQYIVVDIQWYAAGAAGYDYRPGEALTMDEYGRLGVDQHSSRGYESFNDGTFVVWTADAPDGVGHYVAIFSVSDAQKTFHAEWKRVGVGIDMPLTRDLWARHDPGSSTAVTVELPAHAAALYRLTGTKRSEVR
jgi:hypothetical protein